MALTPSTVRLDAGKPCGQSHIAAGKQCQQKGSFPTRKAIAAGLGVAAIGAGAYALHRRNRIQPVQVSFGAPAMVQPGSPRPSLPGDRTTRRLRGTTPKGLLPPSPPRQSKTARMRANTGAAARLAERRIAQTAREEVRRIAQIGNTMAAAGEATGMAAKTGWREVRLRVEAARRRYEPGYRRGQRFQTPPLLPGSSADPLRIGLTPRTISPQRVRIRRSDACWEGYIQVGMKRKGKRRVPNCVSAAKRDTFWATGFDAEDGKKYSKVVTNPQTGRKNKVRYGAKGYKIAPGTNKGDRYCARSFGDMKSHGKDCSGTDRNTPLCLSRAKWKCAGKISRRDGLTPGKSSAW